MKKNRTIVSFLDSPAYGGAEEYLLSNLLFLAQHHYRVILATNNNYILSHAGDFAPLQLIKAPYRLDIIGNWKGLVKFCWDGPRAVVWLLQLHRRLARQHGRLIVLTPGFSDRLLFTPILKLLGDPVIWLEYGPIGPVLKRNFGLPNLMYQLAQRFVDQVITISTSSRDALLAHSQLSSDQVKVIYPGTASLAESQLSQLRQRGEKWRGQHQLGKQPLVCFVGRLANEKEPELLLTAFARLNHPETRLVMVGDGPEKAKYQRLVSQLKLDRQVIFTGFVSTAQKMAILATSQVFVFPSAWELEGFGMTTIEAMMAGCAVVTTGFGPQREIITEHTTGLYFRPHSVNDLAKQIRLLLTNSRLRQKLAKQARRTAQKKFNQTAMQRSILQLVQTYP